MSLRGVTSVAQGFISAPPPDDSFSEAVLLQFDTDIVDVVTLLQVHLHTHASTAQHSMRGKYRSAVYTFNDKQRASCESALSLLQRDFARPLITRVLSFAEFRASDKKYHNYYFSNPDKPFCKTWIDPKLRQMQNLPQLQSPLDGQL